MTLARLSDVVVDLGGRRILDGLSLTVEPADHIAITGRSGSGKTTLLLVLAGLLAPSGGRVELDVAPRDVLYVPQAPSLIAELSAVDNAAVGLRLRGVDPRAALDRAAEELNVLGLGDVLAALPAELSGGMQQRVALARAMVCRPLLLLTDEPTGTLDEHTGGLVLDALRTLADRSEMALVVATHDRDVAGRLSRTVRLTEGRTETAA
jgi:ABC-type lipoprotein export system ATPase subunit